MKKWIISVLVLTLAGGTLSAPSHALPSWLKKNKQEAKAASPQAQSSQTTQPTEPAKTSASPEYASPGKTNPPPAAIPKVQVKSPLTDEVNGLKVEDPVISPELPPEKHYVTVDDPQNPLGITISAQKLNDSAQLISEKKYKEAEKTLLPLKDWLVDATEAHINLHKTLKAIPSAQVQAELEKQLALQFALLRDKAFFQMGMLAIGQEDFPNAIKNLSKVIQSQPRSAMGAQAYEVLQKIGFTERIQLKEPQKGDKQVSQTAE